MKKTKLSIIIIYTILIIIIIFTNISFSKYTGIVKGNDNARVARFCIQLKTTNFSKNTTTLDAIAIGGGYSYYFYVTNQDVKGMLSEVGINYKIKMQENSVKDTKLSYTLYKSDINKVRGSTVTLGSTVINMPISKSVIMQYYELVVSSSASPVGITSLVTNIIINTE